ncbi:MAG: hypothetical protein KUG77_08710 [Nannocystaceae bacterium]|nr:hypothetical protein [Nannocystaceae bacterium]
MLRLGALIPVCTALALGCGPNTNRDPNEALPPADATEKPADSEQPAAVDPSDPATPPSAEPANPVAPAAPIDPLAVLSEEDSATFFAGPTDGGEPLPNHYVKSNERRHDTWFPYVEDLGGAFVGVGPDQCYTIAAAQGAELMFLLDIDHMVVDVHNNYGVLIKASDTPEQLHQRFNATEQDATIALLEEAYADVDKKTRRLRLQTYRASRETIFRHLKHVIERHQGETHTSWLSNPDSYKHIRTLFQNGRVRIMDGDLTGADTMTSIGVAATALQVPVNVLYLSNAEEYYKYSKQYVANVAGLPGDAKSLTLRTIYNKEWEHADSLWNYQVQPLASYQAFLSEGKIHSRNAMFRAADKQNVLERTTDVSGVSRLGVSP